MRSMSPALKRTLWLAVLALVLIACWKGAHAQPAPDPVATLTEDWNAYQNAQKHVIADLNAVANELQKARGELAAVTKERDDLKAQSAKKDEEIKAGAALVAKANAEIEGLKAQLEKMETPGDPKKP